MQLCDRVQNAIVFLLFEPNCPNHDLLMELLIHLDTELDLLLFAVCSVEAIQNEAN